MVRRGCIPQTKDYKDNFLRAILASDFEKTLQPFKVRIFTSTVLLVRRSGLHSVRKCVLFSFSNLNSAFLIVLSTLHSLVMVNYAYEDFQPAAATRSRPDIRHQGVARVSAVGRSIVDCRSEIPSVHWDVIG